VRPWAWLVDLHPRLRALRRGDDGREILRGLRLAFPETPDSQLKRIMRATLRQRAYNVAITLILSRNPVFARFLARAIPLRDIDCVRDLIDGDRSFVLTTFHTGPLYFWIAVVRRVLEGRALYAMHEDGGVLFRDIVRLLHGLGIVSVPNRVMAARTLMRVLKRRARSVVMFACDYSPGAETVTFLGRRIAAAEGARALHDATGAPVICAVWERHGIWPCVRFARACPQPNSAASKVSVMQALFDELEPLVRAVPHRWTSWELFASRAGSGAGATEGAIRA